MDANFNMKLIPLFDGAGLVVKWMEKAELVCRLCSMERLEHIIPLILVGGTFAVYQQMRDKEKADTK